MAVLFKGKKSIVEYKPFPASLLSDQSKLEEVEGIVRKLAGALNVVELTVTGLLPCTSFFRSDDANNPRLGPIYTPPYETGDTNPPTLKDLLNARDSKGNRRTAAYPLDLRLTLARRIASAVYFHHAAGSVHKTIRSNNILMLPNA
ncbi:hypothetical protein B0T10DRAFT_588920 [Thelonectria olida]|uniref:Protein kinase domain-containing protein n=1 Tax=Thelonectria olida TaxID=1576542 RepID=A0A9P8VU93_9HYPO|nr:hypothetical protein B0T10DRAFT_588920 [Thelonectria olida]